MTYDAGLGYDPEKYSPSAVGSQGGRGVAGLDGLSVDTGDWITSHDYAQGTRCRHTYTGFGDSTFRALLDHTSGSTTEPMVGADWDTYWEVFSQGGADGVGAGDTVGAASSTLNDVAGFADVTGKLLKTLGSFASCLSTALSALAAYTTAPVGASDKITMLVGGVWKLITIDNFAKSKKYVSITAQAWRPSATAYCGDPSNSEMTTNKANITSLAFGYNGSPAKTYACYNMKLPLVYDGGTLDAIFTWRSTGTTSNGVRWGIQMASIGDNEALDTAWGSAIEVTDNATGAANRKLIAPQLSTITPSGTPAAGEFLEIRIYRDPAHADDNLNEIVYLDDVTLLIPVDKHSEA